MPLPYYHLAQHPPCPLPQATSMGGELPLWTMGARQQHLRFARGSADSVCLRGRRYLHTHTRAGRGGRRSKEMAGPVDLFVCVYVMYICVCVRIVSMVYVRLPMCMSLSLSLFMCVCACLSCVRFSLRELA